MRATGTAHFINFTPIVTEQVPGMLSRRRCDVGMTLDSRLPETGKNEVSHFENFVLGRFVIAVAANAKNGVRTLTLEDLRSVFPGKLSPGKMRATQGTALRSKSVAHRRLARRE